MSLYRFFVASLLRMTDCRQLIGNVSLLPQCARAPGPIILQKHPFDYWPHSEGYVPELSVKCAAACQSLRATEGSEAISQLCRRDCFVAEFILSLSKGSSQ